MATRKKKPPRDKPGIHVKFVDMKTAGDFDVIPAIGERQHFTVFAECKSEPHKELMADGQARTVIGMKVLEVEPGKIEPAPERDPELPYDDDADDD